MAAKKAGKSGKSSPRKKTPAKKKSGVQKVKLHFAPNGGQETSFSRADLVFTGVEHADMSYEVRVFLNNPKANHKTPRTTDAGYAGRFVVFGHGNCMGEEGHCDASATVTAAYDPVRDHPVTPQTRILTITDALGRVLAAPGHALETVTLVPVSKDPQRKNRGPTADLFKYKSVALETYR